MEMTSLEEGFHRVGPIAPWSSAGALPLTVGHWLSLSSLPLSLKNWGFRLEEHSSLSHALSMGWHVFLFPKALGEIKHALLFTKNWQRRRQPIWLVLCSDCDYNLSQHLDDTSSRKHFLNCQDEWHTHHCIPLPLLSLCFTKYCKYIFPNLYPLDSPLPADKSSGLFVFLFPVPDTQYMLTKYLRDESRGCWKKENFGVRLPRFR